LSLYYAAAVSRFSATSRQATLAAVAICADYISMIEMTTRSAQRLSASNAIAFLYMPTLRARPARVARINGDHRYSRHFRLVHDESAQFRERPF
jgi:hypothetical protein